MKLLLTLLTYPIKVRAGKLRPKVQILNTSLFIIIKLLYFLLAICGYSRHQPMMGQGHGVRLYYGTVFLTQLLKKPRINSEKPINKAITSPQNSLTVKFIRHNIGPVLTAEWPVIDNISPFLRRSLIPSETVSLIPKQLYCTFLLSLSSLIKHKWRSLSRAFLQLNEIFRNTFLIAYHC